jgi:hypothetical protein
MSRLKLSIILVASLAAARAEAIEMFTNFHNGENVGFPPMEVPIRMYPGFGRGGWAPGVVGAPLRTLPPVPAMSPTGPAPMMFRQGGCTPFDTGMSANSQQNMVLARNGRRQRFNSRALAPSENRTAGQGETALAAEGQTPRGLTVLKPENAIQPDLSDRQSIAEESNREPSSIRAEGLKSDSDASAFFQNATSGW